MGTQCPENKAEQSSKGSEQGSDKIRVDSAEA